MHFSMYSINGAEQQPVAYFQTSCTKLIFYLLRYQLEISKISVI